MEIHQVKDKISFSGKAESVQSWVINLEKIQVVANGHLRALGHSISINRNCWTALKGPIQNTYHNFIRRVHKNSNQSLI